MSYTTKIKRSEPRGQSMAEFGLALPILLLVVFGLIEVGRALFMYAAVVNASREAVRYATAYGVNETNIVHYHNCAEIRNTAKRVAFLMPLEDDDITIQYDGGLDAAGVVQPLAGNPECAANETVDDTFTLSCGDRVVVTVTYDYAPIVPLLPQLTVQQFDSSSARTFLGVLELDPASTTATCN